MWSLEQLTMLISSLWCLTTTCNCSISYWLQVYRNKLSMPGDGIGLDRRGKMDSPPFRHVKLRMFFLVWSMRKSRSSWGRPNILIRPFVKRNQAIRTMKGGCRSARPAALCGAPPAGRRLPPAALPVPTGLGTARVDAASSRLYLKKMRSRRPSRLLHYPRLEAPRSPIATTHPSLQRVARSLALAFPSLPPATQLAFCCPFCWVPPCSDRAHRHGSPLSPGATLPYVE